MHTFILDFFFRVSSLLISLFDGPSMKVSGVTKTRDEGAVFLRLDNFVGTSDGISSSDVGCVKDEPEFGVLMRCKADAGVVKGDPFECSESESESQITLRRVRVRVPTWGDKRWKTSADAL